MLVSRLIIVSMSRNNDGGAWTSARVSDGIDSKRSFCMRACLSLLAQLIREVNAYDLCRDRPNLLGQ